jgi:hypothetical protein
MPRKLTPGSSLENMKKEAKRWLKALRAHDPQARARFARVALVPDEPGLRDVQHALAREYGFDGWTALTHWLGAGLRTDRLLPYDEYAADVQAAWHGDEPALRRLIALFGVSYDPEQVRVRVVQRMEALGVKGAPTLEDARFTVARAYDFASWDALVESLEDSRAATEGRPYGARTVPTPPFYRLDERESRIEPRAPLRDEDWDTVFAVMKERGITKISAACMTDTALAKLARLDFVTSVAMDGAQGFSDDGLLHLAAMPQLEELNVSGWHSPLTDRGLEVLRHLKELRRFQMTWPQRVTDAGVANLTFCDHLESVNLMGTPTGDGAINALSGKKQLAKFVTGRLVTDRGLPLLHQVPVFKTWQGGAIEYGLMGAEAKPNQLTLDGPFTDKGLEGLAGLDGVFGLSFFWHVSALTPGGLAPLKQLPRLGLLGCEGKLCNDEAMRHIAAIPDLRMLQAQGTVATDAGFAALSGSKTIEYVWGRECENLTGPGFVSLAAMRSLKGLAVSCKQVDDASLAALPRFPSLEGFMPMDVPDEGFRHVGACGKLVDLWCMYCRDTGDIATGHVAGLKLKSYYAGQTRITDRSLEILGRMDTLEKIEFWNVAGITNAGLAHLAKLPRLREIGIDGPNIARREAVALFPASVRVNA